MKSMDGLATKDSMDGIRLARILSIDSDEVRIAERWLLRELKACPWSAQDIKKISERVGLDWDLILMAKGRLECTGKLYEEIDPSLSMDWRNPLWCVRGYCEEPRDDSDLPAPGFRRAEDPVNSKSHVDDTWSTGKIVALILFILFIMNLAGVHSSSCVRDHLGGCTVEEGY